jgi:hypothetical protein
MNLPSRADVDVGDTEDMMRAAVRSGSVAMLVGIAVACASPPAPSHGAPPTGQPFPADQIDHLPVAIEQAPLVGDSINRDYPPATAQAAQSYPTDAGGPCGQLNGANDDVAAFGPDTLAFRSTRYSGFSNVHVDQAIGVYPDVAHAQARFAKLVDAANACKAAGGPTAIATVAPNVVVWQTPSGSGDAGPTLQADQARLVQNVVARVNVAQFERSPEIAANIADQIAAKINNPA